MSIALQFPRSDGTSTKWPDQLDPTPYRGKVDYMRPIDCNEQISIRWRTLIGREVAKLLGYNGDCAVAFNLNGFPEGYRFFFHYKGLVAEPRTDRYLYGSPAGRFRSAAEFIPHAYWLFTDETLNRENCKCKYCCSSNQPESKISCDMGFAFFGEGIEIPYQNDSNTPKLRPITRPQTPIGTPISSERVVDLRATRRFRCCELVWTALDPPIEGENTNERIDFWPVRIVDVDLKVDVNNRRSGEDRQYHYYGVRLLGLPRADILPESSLLPYLAFQPSTDLVDRIRVTGNPALLLNENNFADFFPIPLSTTNFIRMRQLGFKDAATPFALAIQIAAHLIQFWSPVQKYVVHGEVPSTSSLATQAADGKRAMENRFQGLWWGAEQIWMDELVRLLPSRAQVVSEECYPPSPRADGRGILMRINSISSLPGDTKDCPRIAGILYELAEKNYEEQLPFKPPSCPSIAAPASVPSSSSQPSLPISFSLPEPPPGYKFRRILKPGHELVLDATYIAGRYYPGLFKHPLLKEALNDPGTKEVHLDHDELQSLVCLTSGGINSMGCIGWAPERSRVFEVTERWGRQELLSGWHKS